MPMYIKFLKKILSKKRKIDKHKTIALFVECSVVVLNKLPAKLKDPISFSISYLIGNVSIDRALYDLGSSVSLILYSIFNKLDLGEWRLTNISL